MRDMCTRVHLQQSVAHSSKGSESVCFLFSSIAVRVSAVCIAGAQLTQCDPARSDPHRRCGHTQHRLCHCRKTDKVSKYLCTDGEFCVSARHTKEAYGVFTARLDGVCDYRQLPGKKIATSLTSSIPRPASRGSSQLQPSSDLIPRKSSMVSSRLVT